MYDHEKYIYGKCGRDSIGVFNDMHLFIHFSIHARTIYWASTTCQEESLRVQLKTYFLMAVVIIASNLTVGFQT